jgi:hypothetical protein
MTTMISQLFSHNIKPHHPSTQPYLDFISTLADLSTLNQKTQQNTRNTLHHHQHDYSQTIAVFSHDFYCDVIETVIRKKNPAEIKSEQEKT